MRINTVTVTTSDGFIYSDTKEQSSWKALQDEINLKPDGENATITLSCDIVAETSDGPLVIPEGKVITIDFQNHTINRHLHEHVDKGNVLTNNGTLTLTGTGIVTGGMNAENGGGILNNGTLNLHDVTVMGNTCLQNGGAIYNTGTLNLNGVTIMENTCLKDGGAIYNSGTLELVSGEISRNSAGVHGSGSGGAISAHKGTITMKGGSIIKNIADSNGGGIYLGAVSNSDEKATLNLYGGTITDNTAGKQGGGILHNGILHISGEPVVKNNTGKTGNNIYLRSGKLIHVMGNLLSKCRLGITRENQSEATAKSGESIITQGLSGKGSSSHFFTEKGYLVHAHEDGEACITKACVVTLKAGEGTGRDVIINNAEEENWEMGGGGKFFFEEGRHLFSMPKNPFTAPEGKLFAGWAMKGKLESYAPGDVLDANTYTLTALWKKSSATKPTFKTHSLVLSGLIGINFFMELPEIEGVNYADSYMEFSVSGKDGTVSRDAYDPQERNVTGETYGFTCYVTSIQMADEITATFHFGEGQTVSQTYSVAQYIKDFEAARDSFDDVTAGAVYAVADYGHFMQKILSQANGWQLGIDHAVIPGVSSTLSTEQNIALLQAEVADHAFNWQMDNSKIDDVTFDLTLDSSTTLRVFFTLKEDYDGEFTAYLDNGSENMAVRQPNGRYLVTIPGIPAHLLGHKYMIHGVADGDYFVTLSALTYIDAILSIPEYRQNTEMLDAMYALYQYYRAVMDYRDKFM